MYRLMDQLSSCTNRLAKSSAKLPVKLTLIVRGRRVVSAFKNMSKEVTRKCEGMM